MSLEKTVKEMDERKSSITKAISNVAGYHSITELADETYTDITEPEKDMPGRDAVYSGGVEELAAEPSYLSTTLDNEEEIYDSKPIAAYLEDVDEEEKKENHSESYVLDVEGAQEIYVNAVFAAALGKHTEVIQKDREKLDLFIKCNPAEFGLIQTLYSFTRDVNFAPL